MVRLLLIILLLCPLATAHAFEVAVVQSGLARPYQQVHDHFHQALANKLSSRGLKSISPAQLSSIYLSKEDQPALIRQQLLRQQPDLIVAIGQQALTFVAPLDFSPIIALLVARPQLPSPRPDHILLMPVRMAPEAGLAAVLARLPELQRAGVVYNPEQSGPAVEAAQQALPQLEIVGRPLQQSRYVIRETEALAGKIDLLWLVPDITAVTPLTESTYILFSLQQQVPVLGFTRQQLKRGASFAYVLDLEKMAQQAATFASYIEAGQPISQLATASHAPGRLLVNDIVVNKLGLHLTPEVLP